MDDNERALHTVLAHCMKPYLETSTPADRREQLVTRLLEIQSVVEKRILQNALDKVS
jgi:hypothetical protein